MFGDSAPHRQENRANSVALRARRWASGPRRSVRISRAPVSADLGAHGLDAGVDLSASTNAWGEQFVDALRAQPLDEPLWTSLRRMFDDVVDYMTDPVQAAGAAELQRMINGSASLRAVYLDRMLGNQSRIADVAWERAREAGHGWDDADPAPLALVGAAFACLTAANASVAAGDGPLHEALDRAMAAVGPLA